MSRSVGNQAIQGPGSGELPAVTPHTTCRGNASLARIYLLDVKEIFFPQSSDSNTSQVKMAQGESRKIVKVGIIG